jgi:hypothetical protein
MEDQRKKPVWPWITILLFAVLVGYPLSIGPYLWLSDVASDGARRASPDTWSIAYSAVVFIDPVYDPLRWIMARSEVSDRAWNRYCSRWRIAKSK